MLGGFLKRYKNKIIMIVHREEEIKFFFNTLTMILFFYNHGNN